MTNKIAQKKIQKNLNFFYISALIIALMTIIDSFTIILYKHELNLIHFFLLILSSIMILLLIERKQKVRI